MRSSEFNCRPRLHVPEKRMPAEERAFLYSKPNSGSNNELNCLPFLARNLSLFLGCLLPCGLFLLLAGLLLGSFFLSSFSFGYFLLTGCFFLFRLLLRRFSLGCLCPCCGLALCCFCSCCGFAFGGFCSGASLPSCRFSLGPGFSFGSSEVWVWCVIRGRAQIQTSPE